MTLIESLTFDLESFIHYLIKYTEYDAYLLLFFRISPSLHHKSILEFQKTNNIVRFLTFESLGQTL